MIITGLLAAGCTSGASSPDPAPNKAVNLGEIQLVNYSSCDDLLQGLREAASKNLSRLGFHPGIAYSEAAPAAPNSKTAAQDSGGFRLAGSSGSYSTTNVQEAGVDEPDIVKTDGKRIVNVTDGVLRVIDVATRKVTGSLRILDKEQSYSPTKLLVSGDRALVLVQGVPLASATTKIKPGYAVPYGSKFLLVDLSATEPKLLNSMTAEGEYVDGRMVGSTARLVVRNRPDITLPSANQGSSTKDYLELLRETIGKAPLEAWLPQYEIDGEKKTVPCEQISHPDEYTGTSLVTVHTVDLNTGLQPVSIGVVADGDTVYSSATNLYVASNPYWWGVPFMPEPLPPPVPAPTPASGATAVPAPPPGVTPAPAPAETRTPADPVQTEIPETRLQATPTGGPTPVKSPLPADAATEPPPVKPSAATVQPPPPPKEETQIHRFDLSQPGSPRYVASGKIPGRLLNQYSLSEHEGHLRVATTTTDQVPLAPGPADEPQPQAPTSNGVHVLITDTLQQVGEVTGLGKNERIYSVRFMGPIGYVVTFRQTDPLYSLDLRDPAAPKVTGELKITGFSSYLHPAGDGRLIGVGQEADAKGRILGTQVSLFNVADPANPNRLDQYHEKNTFSEAEHNPHAFLYRPDTGLTVIPIGRNDGKPGGALVLTVRDGKITKQGLLKHPEKNGRNAYDGRTALLRTILIGDSLWTLSPSGFEVTETQTLTDKAWIPLSTQ
ncbi:beta-propeller domain-containing protein [Rhizohabitans arisaemae]|uniref:beta-propeller domain-containing protein n=1 Tax=Rhizohabitans arisaemae TaxID=2720610 RepID=UPI0024B03F39|nr:beta-propeller domain-containing protein [Rhizohabitans arisaemae]